MEKEETLEEKDSLEEQDEQSEDVEQEEKSEAVPLSKYMKERKDRQEAERKLAEYKTAKERTEQENKYVQDGVSPETAKIIAAQDERLAKFEDAQITNQIKELAKSDFYSDAESHTDELKEAIKNYKVSAEQAYMMTQWSPLKQKEWAEKQVQLALYKDGEKEIEPGPAGTTKPKTYPLWDKHDDAAYSELRKAMPGLTKEEYYKLAHE
jgi:hypothetical protein